MIGPAQRIGIFARSFFVQAAWNAERMQNVGFLFALRPALKRIWEGDQTGFEESCARAYAFVNTHPYFAPAVMGVALHIEDKIATGLALPERVDEAKTRITGPLNALGSLWFWDHLRLLSFLAALPIILFSSPAAVAAGGCLFFLIFNFFHLRTRWVGLTLGLRHGEDMLPDLLSLFPPRLLQSFRRASAFLIGLLTPVLLVIVSERLPPPAPGPFSALVSGLVMAVTAMLVIHRRWLSVYQLLTLALALAVGVARWAL
ncbi:MAG: hypothetical protein A3G34_05310 [Candidatus Lindowbacteria bacterium RIFCSPLOWO2_12_FULL_62_27]|nr:MAG: hypothetical protein A3I06_12960 [Candidatus Lindowbacteria bacterium RIFCSPLOWO2_02_FULL_62_12]OGH61403.1 MAG: hypothetical protein A3G34_05310 [Candidatus Lindowbacteria bacterium RIFCSPLOWO2_12_FULL_62_27]